MPKIKKIRKLPHNIGNHEEKMAKRRFNQRQRLPLWSVILLAAFGIPQEKDRNEDFWKYRNEVRPT